MLQIYAKEAIVWGQLRHPNVVPFLGIYYLNEAREQVCLVSPWMKNGNLVNYLKNKPSAPRPLFVSPSIFLNLLDSYSFLGLRYRCRPGVYTQSKPSPQRHQRGSHRIYVDVGAVSNHLTDEYPGE